MLDTLNPQKGYDGRWSSEPEGLQLASEDPFEPDLRSRWRKQGEDLIQFEYYSFPGRCRLLVKNNFGALFIAKRHDGIDARGAAGGHEAGQSCHCQEKH